MKYVSFYVTCKDLEMDHMLVCEIPVDKLNEWTGTPFNFSKEDLNTLINTVELIKDEIISFI